MSTNPLIALRVARPGQPTLRDLAAKIGCSHAHLHSFELGETMMSDELIAAYAKLVRLDPTDIKRRFWYVAMDRAEETRATARAELRKLGVKDPSVKKPRKSA